MLTYFKDRTFDREGFRELAGIVCFSFGFIAYVVVPIVFITVGLEWLTAAILIGVPFALIFLAFFEICFPKDPNKELQRAYGEREKCLSGTRDK